MLDLLEGPEIVVHTDKQTVDESIATILEQLLPRLKAEETIKLQ